MRWLNSLLGRTDPVEPDLDRLFALPAAAVTLQAATGLRPSGTAAVVFKPATGAAFATTDTDLDQLVQLMAEGTQASVRRHDDAHGYRWIVLDDPDLDDQVTTIHAANRTLAERGFGHQLLCSVFAFTNGQPCHLVYLYKRGTFYPFAPRDEPRRDTQLELEVRGALASELAVEDDLQRWFPLWGLPLP
jgi:hypothetical protein